MLKPEITLKIFIMESTSNMQTHSTLFKIRMTEKIWGFSLSNRSQTIEAAQTRAPVNGQFTVQSNLWLPCQPEFILSVYAVQLVDF